MQRSGVRPSVRQSVASADIQRDSPGCSKGRGQRTLPSEYYEVRHTRKPTIKPILGSSADNLSPLM